ncbi:general secretion pathway protein GspK, partial [bacterium]|nr:general secretion pathway protein GspK [bacterium]
MIIIAVVGMIMILTTMNLQISSDTLYTAKYINSIKKKETAYYACKSAVNSARDYIKAGYKEDPKELYDSLQYLESVPLNFDTGYIKINIEIQDLERKFSVNSIVTGDEQEQRDHIEYLKRIFNEIGINSTNVNKIADWIDTDNNIRVDGNENSIKYGSVKNAKIDSLNEL